MTQAEENMHDTEESDFHAQISCQNRLSFNKKSNVMNIHHLEMLHEKRKSFNALHRCTLFILLLLFFLYTSLSSLFHKLIIMMFLMYFYVLFINLHQHDIGTCTAVQLIEMFKTLMR